MPSDGEPRARVACVFVAFSPIYISRHRTAGRSCSGIECRVGHAGALKMRVMAACRASARDRAEIGSKAFEIRP